MNIIFTILFLFISGTVYAQECTQPSCFQQKDKELTGLANTTSAADKVPWYIDADGNMDLADFTAFGRSIVGAANATEVNTILGVSLITTHPRVTVATLPAVPVTNEVVVVTDALAASSCIVNGGTTNVTCQWTGTAWVAIGGGGGGGSVAGTDTQVQFNDSNIMAGDAGLTYDKASNVLTVTGDVIVAGQSVCQEDGTNCPSGGAPAFNTVTAGTNTDKLVVGTGGSLGVTGTGTITPQYTPSGSIAANTVQGAIAELDSETQTALSGKQSVDTELTCLATTTSAANKVPYYTGLGTCATADYTALARGITALTTLTNHGVVLGQGSSAPVATTAGTAGQYLRSGGAAADGAYASIPASEVVVTPGGGLSSTTAAAAFAELDGEKQVADTDLTTVSGLVCAGILVRISASDYQCRTLMDMAGVIDITNPAGQAAAPIIRLNDKVVGGSSHLAIDNGSTDDYAGCPESISKLSTQAYLDGNFVILRPNTANTGAARVNFCTLGLRDIVKLVGGSAVALATGDINVNQPVVMVYDAANSRYQVVSTLATGGGATAGGAPGQVQINTGGNLAGDTGFTFDPATDTLTVLGGLVVGNCSTDCVNDARTATGVRTYTKDISADGYYTLNNGTRTTGDLTRYASDGRLQNAGSSRKGVEIELFAAGVDTAIANGIAYYRVPSFLNGFNLAAVAANVYTAGTTGTISFGIQRCAAAATGNVCSGTVDNMLTTNFTIDSGENSTSTAAAAGAINATNDDVATGQVLRFDVTVIHTTPAQGALISLEFELP